MTLSTTFNAVDKMSGPMRKMRGSVTGFSNHAQRSFRGVGQSINRIRGLVTGAAAALATGAIARSVGQFAEAGDEIAKMSRQLGISAEAFQELRFAADRQGVSAESLESSLGRLNNRVGQLRQGQGSLSTALKNSNPELAEQLKNASDTEEAFMLMMRALNETENAADRTALAQAAFGRSGQALVRMAEAGTDGIEALREEARSYGNIISGDAAGASETFQDTLTNLKATMQGMKNAALVPLMNAIQPLIEGIHEWATANRELIRTRIDQFIQGVKDVVQTLKRAWESGLIPAILAGVAAFVTVTKAVAAYQAIMTAVKAAQLAAAAAGGVFNAVLAANPIGLITIAIAAVIAGLVLLVKNWDKVKEALVAGAQAVGDFFARVWDGIKTAFVVAFDYIKAYYATVADVILTIFGGIVKAVLGTVSSLGKALGFSTEGLDTVIGKIDEVQGKVREASFVGGSTIVQNGREERERERAGLVSPNDGVIRSREVSESRSTVDVNINDRNGRADVRQQGRAPGVTVNTGFQYANLGELGGR